MTAEAEFLLSKKLYGQRTGRDQGRHDVIGYHIRQSFKPGEVSAEEALRLGYELAMRWTRGKHQFVVAAHANTGNPHTHIFYNSVALDCSRKFADFKRSAIALRRVSDKLCLENGLAVIENPRLSKGYNRADYLGNSKASTGRDKLREMIDEFLSVGNSFGEFLVALRKAGCEVKTGKQYSIKPPASKKFFRLDTLGEGYSYEAILERLSGELVMAESGASGGGAEHKNEGQTASQKRQNLLIDIQAKITEGAGAAYVQWMKIFNLKTAARTLLFLKEHGIDSYDELCEKTSALSSEFYGLSERLKAIGTRQKEINELQKHIGNYGKARDVYAKYKASGFDQDFFEINRAKLMLRKVAKDYFDELGMKKLPSINQLRQEWSELEKERRKLCADYKAIKQEAVELMTAKVNADIVLFGERKTAQKAHNRDEL